MVGSSPFLASNLTGYCFHLTSLVPSFNWIVTSFASRDLTGVPVTYMTGVTPFSVFLGISSSLGVFDPVI